MLHTNFHVNINSKRNNTVKKNIEYPNFLIKGNRVFRVSNF